MRHTYKKVTYENAASADSSPSARAIIAAKGDGFGINNTENGVFVNGTLYPKGTVFYVAKGRIVAAPVSPNTGKPMPLRCDLLPITHKGRSFRIRSEFFFCESTGEEFQTEEQMDEQIVRLYAASAKWKKRGR